MFGGLHIQMTALRSIGTLLQNSGWTSATLEAEVASLGTAESLHVMTGKAHQITACSLYELMEKHTMITSLKSLAYQIKHLRIDVNNGGKRARRFQFWNLVPDMEFTIFTLFYSFREDESRLYCEALSELMSYCLISLRITILILYDRSQFTSEI